MKRMSLIAFALVASYVPVTAASDGSLEWTSVTFEDAGGWMVHMATAGDRKTDGFRRLSALEISKRGTAVAIPEAAISEIQDPLLHQVRIMYVCCSGEIRLEIPVLQTDELRSSCKDRHWDIAIIGGRFSAAVMRDEQDRSGNCG